MSYTFRGAPARIQFSTYMNNGVTSMTIISIPEGDPIASVTVNGPWATLRELQKIHGERIVPVKDYSENTGMVDFLLKNELIEPFPLDIIPSGFVLIPVYLLSDKALNELYAQRPPVNQTRKKVNHS